MTPTKKSDALPLFAALLASAAVCGCDRAVRDEFREERAERQYQTAVADYGAGRLEAAADGFDSVVQANPANASARFHLAVLSQDFRKDHLAAVCEYREYLRLAPKSDKAALAKGRLANCEKLLAQELAAKYDLVDGAALKKELAEARESLSAAESRRDELAKGAADAEKRIATLERENAQLKSVLKRMGEDEDDAPAASKNAAPASASGSSASASAARIDDDPDGESAAPRTIAPIAVDDDEDGPLGLNPEAKALFEEEEREAAEAAHAGPASLPVQRPEDAAETKLTDLGRRFGDPMPSGSGAVRSGDRPAFHVVQEGETLSMVALKYYGRKSAWKRIQEANKAVVSSDGKVNAGVRLAIP